MKKILYGLLVLIALLSALKWFVYYSFRINYYEILIVIFVGFYLISNYYKTTVDFGLRKELKAYLLFIWGWFFLAILSGGNILFYPQGAEAYSFYLKGLLQLFVYFVFFTFLIFYLCSISPKKRQTLLNWFLVGVVISSIFGFTQLVLIIRYGIDIDENVSRLLSMSNNTGGFINFARYTYGNFYRLNGITGDPNVHASYSLTALPLFLFMYLENKSIKHLILFLIVFISLILSMSVSGLVGFAFSFLILVILCMRYIKFSYFILFSFLFIILLLFYLPYNEQVGYFLKVKTSPEGTGKSHFDIAVNSLKIGMKYPLGVGYNNFSIAYENQYGISGYNPHNTWIGYFVQMGFIGFLYQVIFSIFIIIKCFKKKTVLSQVFIASFVGICIASFGYQVLDMFFVQLFITMFFTLIMLGQDKNKLLEQQ